MLEFYKYITTGIVELTLFYLLFLVLLFTILSFIIAIVKTIIQFIVFQILIYKRATLEVDLEFKEKLKKLDLSN